MGIRAIWTEEETYSGLSNVQMDYASHEVADRRGLMSVKNMEFCQCPPKYTGPSCQSCSHGYWRGPNGCIPCSCNGHSEFCHPVTGKCRKCRHNTAGDACHVRRRLLWRPDI